MPNTCKTCKYWIFQDGKETHYESDVCKPIDCDTCKPMQLTFEMRICKHPNLYFSERPMESNGIAVVDGSEYFASLLTGEDFGCILHEEGDSNA